MTWVSPGMTTPIASLRTLTVVSLLALAACGGDGPSVIERPSLWAGRVLVTGDAKGLHVQNGTTSPIGYIAVDEQLIPVIDWIPCLSDDGQCPRLVPGGPHLVPAARIV